MKNNQAKRGFKFNHSVIVYWIAKRVYFEKCVTFERSFIKMRKIPTLVTALNLGDIMELFVFLKPALSYSSYQLVPVILCSVLNALSKFHFDS